MWSGNFVSQAQSIRDRLSLISDRFNSHLIRQLSIVRDYQETIVSPNPRIEQVSITPDAVEGINNLKGVAKKYNVAGVSKVYSRDAIEQEGTTFLIDRAIKCYLVPGTVKEGVLAWEFQLEEVVIERNLYS